MTSKTPPNSYHADAGEILDSRKMNAGDENYRAYVGPPRQYDFMGATQFNLATSLGLREEHMLLDVGCGSLRSGRLMLQYLLPGHYHGLEPNDWLWRDAFKKEIGTCVEEIKAPVFLTDENFSFSLFGKEFDFIIAQSVFSHTAMDIFAPAVANATGVLKENGQFLFTVLSEGTSGFGRLPDGTTETGWFYPSCVTFTEKIILDLCQKKGLIAQKIPWFHPRQQWFRAVKKEDMLIKDIDNAFKNGNILFDERFTA